MHGPLLAVLALSFVQASWSYAGSQGLGFCVTLIALVRDPGLRQRLWQDYRGAFNTNPLMAGTVAGIVVHHEARGERDAARLSGALQSSLAGVGDVLFWKTLRPGLSAAAVASAGFVPVLGPLVLLAPFTIAGEGMRQFGLLRGLERGTAAALEITGLLNRLNRWLVPAFAVVSGFLCVRAVAAGPAPVVLLCGGAAWFLLGVRRLGPWLLPLALLAMLFVKVVS